MKNLILFCSRKILAYTYEEDPFGMTPLWSSESYQKWEISSLTKNLLYTLYTRKIVNSNKFRDCNVSIILEECKFIATKVALCYIYTFHRRADYAKLTNNDDEATEQFTFYCHSCEVLKFQVFNTSTKNLNITYFIQLCSVDLQSYNFENTTLEQHMYKLKLSCAIIG